MNKVQVPYNRVILNNRPKVYNRCAPQNFTVTRSKNFFKKYPNSYLSSAADNVINNER
jgi:hypothetical protein